MYQDAKKDDNLRYPELWKNYAQRIELHSYVKDMPFAYGTWKKKMNGQSFGVAEALFDDLADALYEKQLNQVRLCFHITIIQVHCHQVNMII